MKDKVTVKIWDGMYGAIYLNGKKIPLVESIQLSEVNAREPVKATITVWVDEVEAELSDVEVLQKCLKK
jgi:hypothetical protein